MALEFDEDYKVLKEGKVDGTDVPVRINDATSGPDGSFYGGTDRVGWKDDAVFRLNTDGSVDVIDEGVELCNGMGFSPDLLEFYSTDTIKKLFTNGTTMPHLKQLQIKECLLNTKAMVLLMG